MIPFGIPEHAMAHSRSEVQDTMRNIGATKSMNICRSVWPFVVGLVLGACSSSGPATGGSPPGEGDASRQATHPIVARLRPTEAPRPTSRRPRRSMAADPLSTEASARPTAASEMERCRGTPKPTPQTRAP